MDFLNCTDGAFPTGSVGYGPSESPGIPPRKILLTLTLSVLAVLTTVINCLVITAIIVTRKLHHPANYLICSLAVTDLLVAVLVMPFSIVYIQQERWSMGQLLCTMWLSVDITCCTCSILHLAAIAVDRYRAITDAVEYSRKRTGARAGAMVAVVWLLSILISLPHLLWRHHNGDSAEEDQCVITHHHLAFTLYATLGAFYIPLLLILILYYKIYKAAQTLYMRREASRASRHSCMTNGSMIPSAYAGGDRDEVGVGDGEPRSPDPLSPPEKSFSDPSTDDRACVRVPVKSPRSKKRRGGTRRRGGGAGESWRSRESRRTGESWRSVDSRRSQSYRGPRISGSRERKAASTLGLILGAFVVCWLPFFVKEVIVNTCGSCSTSTEMADFLTWLGYLNSLINPLIYTVFNEDFKKAFQRLFRCSSYL